MEKRTLWRVEHPNGEGPYEAGVFVGAYPQTIDHDVYQSPECPSPHDDGIADKAWARWGGGCHELHFAFASLAQYRRWFATAKTRQHLARCGCALKRISVPADAVVGSKYQCAFRKTAEVEVLEVRSPDIGA